MKLCGWKIRKQISDENNENEGKKYKRAAYNYPLQKYNYQHEISTELVLFVAEVSAFETRKF